MTVYCFIDTETTGLSALRRPWEIAIVRRDENGERDITIQVSDIDLSNAEPRGLQIGRFYQRHHKFCDMTGKGYAELESSWPIPANALFWVGTEAQAARTVEKWTRDATIVGAVPSFDTECLEAMLRRHGLAASWKHRLRCVETVACGHLRRELGGLADCAAALGIDFPESAQHTAMGDVKAAMAIWDLIIKGDE